MRVSPLIVNYQLSIFLLQRYGGMATRGWVGWSWVGVCRVSWSCVCLCGITTSSIATSRRSPAAYLCRTQISITMGKYTYKPQYGVIVICRNEEEQRAIFERLKKEGLTLKIVNV